jgi:hypothetical protein
MAGTFEGLTDLEWKLFADLFPPPPAKRGRGMPPTPLRKVVNTLLYVLITGCRWCDLPRGPQRANLDKIDTGGEILGMNLTTWAICYDRASR